MEAVIRQKNIKVIIRKTIFKHKDCNSQLILFLIVRYILWKSLQINEIIIIPYIICLENVRNINIDQNHHFSTKIVRAKPAKRALNLPIHVPQGIFQKK